MEKIHYILIENTVENEIDLTEIFDRYPVLKSDGVFSTIQDAVEFLDKNSTDVVFMNYNMGDPKYSGDAFFMCSLWNQSYPDMMTVLYGEDENMAYTAAKFCATSFFTIPADLSVTEEVIKRIIYRADLLSYKTHAKNTLVMIKTKEGYQLIQKSRILFVERINRKNRMITIDGEEIWLANYSMEELTSLLSKCGFYRCYQSYIVNVENISEVCINNKKKIYTLRFRNSAEEILLSRDKYNEVLELLRSRYSNVLL